VREMLGALSAATMRCSRWVDSPARRPALRQLHAAALRSRLHTTPLPTGSTRRGLLAHLAGASRCCSSAPEPSPKIKALVDEIAGLTLLEASELTDALKERLGITSAMMMPAGAAPAGGAPAAAAPAEEEEKPPEKTTFTVRLEKFDAASKIKLIKEVRALTGLGLKEAKELVEGVPKDVKADVKKEEAEEIKAKLEGVGGSVAID